MGWPELRSDPRAALLAAANGALVAAAGSSGPRVVSLRAAVGTALVAPVATTLAFATVGRPLAAAAAMAAVAVVTSVAVGAGPGGAHLGVLGAFGYVLTTSLATLLSLHTEVTPVSGAFRNVLGAACGLVVVVGTAWRERHGPRKPSPVVATPWRTMARSLRTLDVYARDGIRRAVPLAIGIYVFQRTGSRDALWVFIAAFAVLLPSGKAPTQVALLRAVSTLAAVVALGFLVLVVPVPVLVVAAGAFLILGIAYADRYPLAGTGLMSIAVVVMTGAPSGDIESWALHRLVDTLLGCLLAVAATLVLWPRDPAARPGAVFSGQAPADR